MFLLWIIPPALVILLVRAMPGGNLANVFRPVASRACQNGSRLGQATWKICPHSGQTL